MYWSPLEISNVEQDIEFTSEAARSFELIHEGQLRSAQQLARFLRVSVMAGIGQHIMQAQHEDLILFAILPGS